MKQKQRKFLRTFGGEKAVRNGERSLAERLLHNFLTSGHPNATGQVIFGWPEGKFDSFLSYDSAYMVEVSDSANEAIWDPI